MRYTFISYEEAKELKPIFQKFRKEGPWKDVRGSASRILEELEFVKDADYFPLSGQQVVLEDKDYEFFENAREAFGV